MADNTLLNYLRTVLNLEVQCRTLSSSMERNRKQVASYSSYNNQEKPSPPLAPVPDTGAEIFMFVVGALCIFMIIGGIRLIISGYELLAVPVIGLIIFGCLFAYIISAGISGNKEDKKWCAEQKQQYEELISNIDRQKEAIRQALPILNNDYEILEKQYQETRSLLTKYYDLDIIYPKYRGIVPIAMFVQYFESGIVYRLQGPDGAFHLPHVLRHVFVSLLWDGCLHDGLSSSGSAPEKHRRSDNLQNPDIRRKEKDCFSGDRKKHPEAVFRFQWSAAASCWQCRYRPL